MMKTFNNEEEILETSFAAPREALSNGSGSRLTLRGEAELRLSRGRIPKSTDANLANETGGVEEEGAIWCCLPLCRRKKKKEVMPLPTVTSQLEERRHGVSFYAAAMQVQKRNNTLRVFQPRVQSASARNLTHHHERRRSSEATLASQDGSMASTASSSGRLRSPPIASLYDAAMAMQRRANAKERGRRAFLSRISRQATNKVSPEGAEGGSHEDDGEQSSNAVNSGGGGGSTLKSRVAQIISLKLMLGAFNKGNAARQENVDVADTDSGVQKNNNLTHNWKSVRKSIGDISISSTVQAKELQDRLESGLERELGFEIRDGDIVLGNFEDLEMASTVDKKAGQHIKRKRRKSTEARERLKWNRSATMNNKHRRDSQSSNSSQSSRPTTAGSVSSLNSVWSMEGLEEEEEDDDDESVMTSKANAPKLAGSKEQTNTPIIIISAAPDQKRTRKPKAKRRGTPGHTDLVLDIPTEKEAMRGANGDFTHMNNGSGNKRFVPPSSTEGRPLAVKGSVADTVNRAFGKK